MHSFFKHIAIGSCLMQSQESKARFQQTLPPDILASVGIAQRFNITHEKTLRAATALVCIEKGAKIGREVGLFFNADPALPESMREIAGAATGSYWGAVKGYRVSQKLVNAGKSLVTDMANKRAKAFGCSSFLAQLSNT